VDLPEQPGTPYFFFEPPKRFQHKYWIHIVLFLATLASTTYVGRTTTDWTSGLWYSLPILIILTAHEFGHYVACRIHKVDATLPFYIPAPFLALTGTLGAVIKIREPFPNKRALFDIGVAGPIAGFVMLIPFLWWGIAHSQVAAIDHSGGSFSLGEPLLLKFFSRLSFGRLSPDTDVMIHQTGFAAWFGMLATALNLMPFGQLDGGHIAYAAFGRKARYVSMATLGIMVLLTIWSLSWIAMTIMMAAMAVLLGFGHPHVIDEHEPLDRERTLVAILAVIIFVICFTPVPIEVLFDR
jgi:membrane-associated protease RseP (regulator of RpoE activity)